MTEENKNIANAQEVLLPGCTPTVSAEVCVEADVTVTPTVVPGRPIVNCVGTPSLTRCRALGYTPSTTNTCTFTFSQVLCVNIPVTFDANATAQRGVVACGLASPAPNCQEEPSTGCTLTRGMFQTNTELTLQLLALAGGTIVLGSGNLGFSFTVDSAADVTAVFTNAVPGSPSPQYNQLYAQLLTANLNILNGASCPEVLVLIAQANLFLTNPVEDSPEASDIQEQLALFNEGNLTGCPGHC
jgi:hypothetical protein